MFSSSVFADVSALNLLGYALLSVGLLATLFSKHRYLLFYLFGGMAYWLVVEALQTFLVSFTSVSLWNSYLLALAMTWVIAGVLFAVRLNRKDRDLALSSANDYQEHTPVYNNYKPKYRS